MMQYIPEDVKLPLPEGYYGHLHNIYIHYAAERGIPTMLALMWMVARALYDFALGIAPASGTRRTALDSARGHRRQHRGHAERFSYELNLGDSEVLAMFLAVIACGYVACGYGAIESGLITGRFAPINGAMWPAPLNRI